MSPIEPDANFAPPVVICTIPSEPASANPRMAALRMLDEVTLTAG